MSKRVPVYLSESELETLVSLMDYNEDQYPRFGLFDNLRERLEAELATFEE